MKKHLLLFIMTCFMVAAALSFNTKSARADVMGSVSDGTLTISGTGAMADLSNSSSQPWYAQRTNIKKIVINSGVTSIGKWAFGGLSNVTSVTIPSTVTSIGQYAFQGCSSLTSISIPSSVTTLGDCAFLSSGLTSVNIPNSVTTVGTGVFEYCTSMTTCSFTYNVTMIPNYAFYGCSALKSFYIPTKITSIGEKAFGNCTSLAAVTFKPATKSIGKQAFLGCSALANMYFACNAPTFGSQCFYGVTATATYIKEADNATWTSSVLSTTCGSGTITWKADYMYFTSFVLATTSYTYDGTAKKPGFTVKSGDYTHVEGTDYTVTYTNNTNVGTATAEFTTMGVWGTSHTIKKTFTIGKADTTMTTNIVSISGAYPGRSYSVYATPAKTDATFSYSFASSDTSVATVSSSGLVTAVKAGSCKITVTCTSNNYNTMTKEIPVTVLTPTNLSTCSATLSTTSYTYDGTAKKPTVTVKNGTSTVSTSYYDVAYSNNINAGTATVTITGKYAYTGTKTITFTINKAKQYGYTNSGLASGSNIAVNMTTNLVMTGTQGAVTYSTSDSTIASIDTNGVLTAKKAGTVYVYFTVAATTNYAAISYTNTYTVVNPTSVSNCTVTLSATSYTYTGSAIRPSVTVTNGTTTLTNGTDYTYYYSDNTNAGTASVTILGKNFYTGSSSRYFTITQASQTLNASISSYTIETGKTATISVPGAKTTAALTYSSSNTSVATVSTSGVVTAKAVGTAIITVNAPADTNYNAASASFSINVKSSVTSITSGTLTLGTNSYTYDGAEKKPAVTVTLSGKTLVNNTDYVVAYSNNIHAGTATVTVSGTGNYADTLTKTFTINRANQTITANSSDSTLTVGATKACSATAEGDVTFASDNEAVAAVNEYGIITAKSEGTAKITISAAATSDYNAATKTFTVTVKNAVTELTSGNVTLDEDSFKYDGEAKTPAVTVKVGDKTLTKDTDYTVAYASNINAGTAKVTVTGKGDYTGTVEKEFGIAKLDQNLTAKAEVSELEIGQTAEIKVSGIGSITFESSDTSVATVAKKDDTTLTVTAVAAGSVSIKVTAAGNDNVNGDSENVSFVVKKAVKDISSCTITLGKESYTFNDDEHRPSVTVLDGDSVLTEGMDYSVLYENFVNAGTATATISGKGDYSGKVTKEYTINKAEQNVTATVDATTLKIGGTAKITVTSTGEMIFESEDSSIATVNQTDKNTATVKALKAGITKVWITVEESENYKGGSAELVFTVNPKQVTGLKASNSTTGVSLTWTKLSGVTGYQVYRKTGSGSYSKVATVTTNKYVDKKASNGSTYTYKVRAYLSSDKTLYGPYSATAADTWLTRPAISSAKNVATRSILVKWAKNSKATGYEVQYSTSSAFKSAKTVKITKAATVSKTITSLTKGKTYYVRIRTYKTVSGSKKYSAYSASKKVKIAK